jgi:putative FmdB family regulatory protein
LKVLNMPTYEYECKSCGHDFEVFQAMSEEPLKDCPKCGKEVRRLIFGGAGVIFKGSGFYVTDKGKASGNKSDVHGTDKKAKTETASGDGAPVAACANCPANSGSASAPASADKCPAKAASESKTA